MRRAFLFAIIVYLSSTGLLAQVPLSYHTIREADVMWSMRVWRELDFRQKLNHPLYYPTENRQGYSSLYRVLENGIISGNITAYGTGPLDNDDEFNEALSPKEFKALTRKCDSVWTPTLDGGGLKLVVIRDSVRSEMITRYRIKEDWVFDCNRSQLVVRIIGIAPLIEKFTEDGISRGFTTLFWVPFEETRAVLAEAPVFIRHNNNRSLNYDDIFAKRFFTSRIVKASNVYDRAIVSYASGVDALMEAQAIEEKILNFESDLWSY